MNNIIFDIDGTLWDSTSVVADSWNDAIKDTVGINANLTSEQLKQLFGKTMDEIGMILLPDLDDATRKKVCDACYEYEDNHLIDHAGTFYTGVIDTINELAKNYKLYIVSNCQCGYIELVLKHGNFTDKITDHLCFGDTGLHKGETIKLLMQKNNISLDDAIYVGDIQGDFEACKIAHIPMIYASYGFGKVKNPDYTINDIRELPKLMQEINK